MPLRPSPLTSQRHPIITGINLIFEKAYQCFSIYFYSAQEEAKLGKSQKRRKPAEADSRKIKGKD